MFVFEHSNPKIKRRSYNYCQNYKYTLHWRSIDNFSINFNSFIWHEIHVPTHWKRIRKPCPKRPLLSDFQKDKISLNIFSWKNEPNIIELSLNWFQILRLTGIPHENLICEKMWCFWFCFKLIFIRNLFVSMNIVALLCNSQNTPPLSIYRFTITITRNLTHICSYIYLFKWKLYSNPNILL